MGKYRERVDSFIEETKKRYGPVPTDRELYEASGELLMSDRLPTLEEAQECVEEMLKVDSSDERQQFLALMDGLFALRHGNCIVDSASAAYGAAYDFDCALAYAEGKNPDNAVFFNWETTEYLRQRMLLHLRKYVAYWMFYSYAKPKLGHIPGMSLRNEEDILKQEEAG